MPFLYPSYTLPTRPFRLLINPAAMPPLHQIIGIVDKVGKFVVFPSLVAGLAWGVRSLVRRVK